MKMMIVETGQKQTALRVDLLLTGSTRQIRTDRGDPVALDPNVETMITIFGVADQQAVVHFESSSWLGGASRGALPKRRRARGGAMGSH